MNENLPPIYVFADDSDALQAEVERLQAEVEALRFALRAYVETDRTIGVLRRLEWAGTYHGQARCPACGGEQQVGHTPACWLAAELDPAGGAP